MQKSNILKRIYNRRTTLAGRQPIFRCDQELYSTRIATRKNGAKLSRQE